MFFRLVCLKLLWIAAVVMLTIGSALAQNTRSTKVIKLEGYTGKYSVILDYDSAMVSLSLLDVRDQLTQLRERKKFSSGEFQKYFTETLNAISADKDHTFRNSDIFSAAGIIEQYTFRTLISKGKAKVFNKRSQRYENRIKRTYYRSTIAGERHEGYEFTFINGTIFFIDRISI